MLEFFGAKLGRVRAALDRCPQGSSCSPKAIISYLDASVPPWRFIAHHRGCGAGANRLIHTGWQRRRTRRSAISALKRSSAVLLPRHARNRGPRANLAQTSIFPHRCGSRHIRRLVDARSRRVGAGVLGASCDSPRHIRSAARKRQQGFGPQRHPGERHLPGRSGSGTLMNPQLDARRLRGRHPLPETIFEPALNTRSLPTAKPRGEQVSKRFARAQWRDQRDNGEEDCPSVRIALPPTHLARMSCDIFDQRPAVANAATAARANSLRTVG